VVQIRAEDVSVKAIGSQVVAALREAREELSAGARKRRPIIAHAAYVDPSGAADILVFHSAARRANLGNFGLLRRSYVTQLWPDLYRWVVRQC
jgi:hypothetical protein